VADPDRSVEVIVQIAGADVLAGRLWSHRRGNAESATFAYDDGYVGRRQSYPLEPALPLRSGQNQTPVGHALFGAFSDCAPDGWGRRLINRSERAWARTEGRSARLFGELDYLLGVRDDMRQGAVRFRDPGTGPFLATEDSQIPPVLDLSRLLSASARLDRDQASDEDLRILLRGGSSLGGARPKAHVIDHRGRVAIAKFPRATGDDWDVTAWERVAIQLAQDAGIRVPDADLLHVDGKPVLLVTRFDRQQTTRLGYVSAMTMLEARERDQRDYLEIAEVVEEQGLEIDRDLRQLWRRIAFSRLISNVDDHLRNHGFLRTSISGWELSPAFDLNPDPTPKPFSTAIDGDDSGSIQSVLRVAGWFRLDDTQAAQVLREVTDATSRWRGVARTFGVSAAQIDAMAPAFDHERATEAQRAAVP
jgi:serine/threonine-protein kinase HipA